MEILQERYLSRAERDQRFSPQISDFHLIVVQRVGLLDWIQRLAN